MNQIFFFLRPLLVAFLFMFHSSVASAQVQGRGGPDLYGYTWRDSYDSVGPLYSWVDITWSLCHTQ